MEKLAYSIAEACELTSVGRTKLYQAISAGELTPRKVGRKTLLLAEDLKNWLASRLTGPR